LDTVAVKMLDLEIANLPIFDTARAQGLGVSSLEQIEVTGDYRTIPSLKNFKMSRASGQFKNPNGKIFGMLVDFLKTRPRINHKRCKKCNVCVESCPVQVIERETKGIDYSKCIECLCCHELCMYQAVEIKNVNWLAGVLMGVMRGRYR
ncbi:MAG TPA: 4Fe-4S binding protein, partial [Bacillota bacterium]|nr:4Fe-4S binding protein [Bacillota bacterium]